MTTNLNENNLAENPEILTDLELAATEYGEHKGLGTDYVESHQKVLVAEYLIKDPDNKVEIVDKLIIDIQAKAERDIIVSWIDKIFQINAGALDLLAKYEQMEISSNPIKDHTFLTVMDNLKKAMPKIDEVETLLSSFNSDNAEILSQSKTLEANYNEIMKIDDLAFFKIKSLGLGSELKYKLSANYRQKVAAERIEKQNKIAADRLALQTEIDSRRAETDDKISQVSAAIDQMEIIATKDLDTITQNFISDSQKMNDPSMFAARFLEFASFILEINSSINQFEKKALALDQYDFKSRNSINLDDFKNNFQTKLKNALKIEDLSDPKSIVMLLLRQKTVNSINLFWQKYLDLCYFSKLIEANQSSLGSQTIPEFLNETKPFYHDINLLHTPTQIEFAELEKSNQILQNIKSTSPEIVDDQVIRDCLNRLLDARLHYEDMINNYERIILFHTCSDNEAENILQTKKIDTVDSKLVFSINEINAEKIDDGSENNNVYLAFPSFCAMSGHDWREISDLNPTFSARAYQSAAKLALADGISLNLDQTAIFIDKNNLENWKQRMEKIGMDPNWIAKNLIGYESIESLSTLYFRQISANSEQKYPLKLVKKSFVPEVVPANSERQTESKTIMVPAFTLVK
ncbi:MAG: hypothetical protein NTW50_04000 [Candidatus Berkelbacteria bacterium]|nr:hypothetical protein [Candidatus Berkelbacteria bacterium]